jgi:hypothetical protein
LSDTHVENLKERYMNRSMLRAALGALSFAVLVPSFAAPPGGLPASGTFDLFTAAEASAWNTKKPAGERSLGAPKSLGGPGEVNCHSIPAAAPMAGADPQIKLLAPTLGAPLSAPVNIDLQFVPAAAPIKPETFRVCYLGFLTVDITQRITDRVAVSPTGISVSGAQLPAGHHHLVMLIADSQGHYGHQEVIFDIK